MRVFFSIVAVFVIVTILSLAVRPDYVFAAEIVLDTSIFATRLSTMYGAPTSVCINDTTCFVFYLDSGGGISMASTTNGGVTWQSGRNVDSVNTTDAVSVSIWWDGWTPPGTTTQYIHIATIDTGVDDIYYTRYDTTNNTFSTTVVTTTQVATMSRGANTVAITKTPNNKLYVATTDGSDSWMNECSTTCTSTANWSEKTGLGFNIDGAVYLAPIPGGDNVLFMHQRYTAAFGLYYNVWSATSSAWFGIKNTTDLTTNNTEYDGQLSGLGFSTSTGAIRFITVKDANNYTTADHDLLFLRYASTTNDWTSTTSIATNVSGGLTGAKLAFDELNDVWYAIYTRRTTITNASTSNIYYSTSSDDGVTWSAEKGPINGVADDLTGLGVGLTSFERIGVVWNYLTAPTSSDLYYSDVVDIQPTSGGGGGEAPPLDEIYILGITVPSLREDEDSMLT